MSGSIPRGQRVDVDAETVRRLVRDQFPEWAGLDVEPVTESGWDNHTFRLGNEMKVRLPASEIYLPQAEKETTWLPRLAPHLPCRVPRPLGHGGPGHGYPFPWSVWDWIDGDTAASLTAEQLPGLAGDVAAFLIALQRCPTEGAPPAGSHSFHRGGDLTVYDAEIRRCLPEIGHLIDVRAVGEIWRRALTSGHARAPIWVHGDIAYGNLLVRDGRLSAVIDFGTSAIGDPACDLVISWTLFDQAARDRFGAALPFDKGTWDRARGWCVWKAALVLSQGLGDPEVEQRETAIIEAACDGAGR